MKEPENKVYIDLSTGQVMTYKDTLIASQLYALFQDEFIEKLADAIVKKNEERSEEKWRAWVKSQMRDPEEVAKATGTEPSHTVGGWTIEGEGEE